MKVNAHVFYQKHFTDFYNLSTFSENFETIFINMRFQLCLAAGSIVNEFIKSFFYVLEYSIPITPYYLIHDLAID